MGWGIMKDIKLASILFTALFVSATVFASINFNKESNYNPGLLTGQNDWQSSDGWYVNLENRVLNCNKTKNTAIYEGAKFHNLKVGDEISSSITFKLVGKMQTPQNMVMLMHFGYTTQDGVTFIGSESSDMTSLKLQLTNGGKFRLIGDKWTTLTGLDELSKSPEFLKLTYSLKIGENAQACSYVATLENTDTGEICTAKNFVISDDIYKALTGNLGAHFFIESLGFNGARSGINRIAFKEVDMQTKSGGAEKDNTKKHYGLAGIGLIALLCFVPKKK